MRRSLRAVPARRRGRRRRRSRRVRSGRSSRNAHRRRPGRRLPICSTRSPMRTPLIATGSGSRPGRWSCAKTCAFPHDIVAGCDSTTRDRPCTRQAWRAARRPRRRQHDDHRRRAGDPQGAGAPDRLADPDGHHPSRQAHRRRARRRSTSSSPSPASTTSSSAAGTSSRKTATRRPARPACSSRRSSSRSAAELEAIKPMPAVFDQRYVKRLDGPERQEGQEQARPRRAAHRRHPRLQGEARLRPAGHDLVRQHRGLHEGDRRARHRRLVREGARSRATTRFRRAWSTPTRRSARAFRSPTPRRT